MCRRQLQCEPVCRSREAPFYSVVGGRTQLALKTCSAVDPSWVDHSNAEMSSKTIWSDEKVCLTIDYNIMFRTS